MQCPGWDGGEGGGRPALGEDEGECCNWIRATVKEGSLYHWERRGRCRYCQAHVRISHEAEGSAKSTHIGAEEEQKNLVEVALRLL